MQGQSEFRFLESLLTLLIGRYGEEAVEQSFRRVSSGRAGVRTHVPSKNRVRTKPTPVDLARKVKASENLKPQLIKIAEEFEAKEFLPRIADVRHFLVMHGENEPRTNNRPEAFRQVLEYLITLPEDRLRDIRNELFHGGPARLGPLSDAIGEAGNQIRRRAG